jgi:hypothetical protein
MARPRLFISHTSQESDFAQLLKQRIRKDFLGSVDIFVSSDGTTIEAGRPWLDELRQSLQDARIALVLCSTDSITRPWVNFEAGAAWIRGISLIPICHSGFTPADLPAPLNTLQAVDASQASGLRRLYNAIASQLQMEPPTIDFDEFAEAIRHLEQELARRRDREDRVENPRILCAASAQYARPIYGFEQDVEIVSRAFPSRVTTERELTSRKLREYLTSGEAFEILHLVMPVSRENGDLIFTETDPTTLEPSTPDPDILSPQGLASLLPEGGTRLVVLATCQALLLAVEVGRTATMIATDTEITGAQAADWAESFYSLLANGYSVYRAFDITRTNSKVPMRLVTHRDVAFGRTAAR